jgi:hypothetical protein
MAAIADVGCADSESMLFIRQVQARLSTGATACAADNAPTSPSLPLGTLDVAYRSRYTATLLVGNQLVPRGDNTQLRTETSRVDIQGTIVRALDDAGNVVWGPVTVPGTGFIEPASGATPSFGLTETTLFQADAALIASMQGGGVKHDIAIAKVFGRSLGGTDVESGEWQFPIDICFQCLIQFPSEANGAMAGQPPNCDAISTTGTTVEAPCNPGQDDSMDCRACKQIFFNNLNACEPN